MPWTVDDPPPPARNRSRADRLRCVESANAVLRDGGWDDLGEEARKELEQQAIFACISVMDEQSHAGWFVPIEKALDDVLIFPIGKYSREGKEREFTVADAEEMVRNFQKGILGRAVPVNREHDRPGGRVGKVLRLWVADDGVRGELEDDGAAKRFGYVSPEVRWEWTHPYTGEVHKNVLMGLALTNYPFFLGKMSIWADDAWETYTEADVIMLNDIGPKILSQEGGIEVICKLLDLPDGRPLHLSADDERQPFVHEMPIVQVNEAQRIAYGVVLQPGVPDGQGHVMDMAEIEAACHRYMEKVPALDEHHARDVASGEAKVVECWIQREPVMWKYGERETEVLPGSWCLGVKFYSDELWEQVVDGGITGFSPKGWGKLKPAEV